MEAPAPTSAWPASGRLAAARGVTVEWQPFYLLPIFIEQGMNLGPFLPYPNKMEYMWRDIERRAVQAIEWAATHG